MPRGHVPGLILMTLWMRILEYRGFGHEPFGFRLQRINIFVSMTTLI
jgi:hypothetical protein